MDGVVPAPQNQESRSEALILSHLQNASHCTKPPCYQNNSAVRTEPLFFRY